MNWIGLPQRSQVGLGGIGIASLRRFCLDDDLSIGKRTHILKTEVGMENSSNELFEDVYILWDMIVFGQIF